MKLLVINGPNINMLGIREPEIYGTETYEDLCRKISDYCTNKNISVDILQSNHEGNLVDYIQKAYNTYDAIIINPAAYTHTSIAIRDALKAVNLPTIEVHISDINKREEFRRINFISDCCIKSISGLGTDGYLNAIDEIVRCLR